MIHSNHCHLFQNVPRAFYSIHNERRDGKRVVAEVDTTSSSEAFLHEMFASLVQDHAFFDDHVDRMLPTSREDHVDPRCA